MKRILLVLVLIIAFGGLKINSQDGVNNCNDLIKSPFISNGQPFKAFLTNDEVAEFHTTFFGGSQYRLVACSAKNSPIIFSIYDMDRNLLFSNDKYGKAKMWDFNISGSLECIIEARLDKSKEKSGIALMYVGFKNLKEQEK